MLNTFRQPPHLPPLPFPSAPWICICLRLVRRFQILTAWKLAYVAPLWIPPLLGYRPLVFFVAIRWGKKVRPSRGVTGRWLYATEIFFTSFWGIRFGLQSVIISWRHRLMAKLNEARRYRRQAWMPLQRTHMCNSSNRVHTNSSLLRKNQFKKITP